MFHQIYGQQFGHFLTLLLSTYTYFTLGTVGTFGDQTGHRLQTCLFPSVHQRVAIYECQHSAISPPVENYHSTAAIWWCPLTDNFDHYPEWRICPETATTYGGNHPGQTCYFPFTYQGKLHQTCIRSGGELHFDPDAGPLPHDNGQSGYWWCGTTENFDRDRQWTRCSPHQPHQLPCHFRHPLKTGRYPIIGGQVGRIDEECQPFSGHWVCQTELHQLRECPSVSAPDVDQQTEGGNSPGFQCHFPFQVTLPLPKNGVKWIGPSEKRNFSTCLPGTESISSDVWRRDREATMFPSWIGYWCSTTENFDRDRLWTRCGIRALSGGGISLASVWSHLGWFTQLSQEEKRHLQQTADSQVYTRDFQAVLSSLERQRMLFEQENHRTGLENNQINWWTWLAPLWWASYLANYTEPVVFKEILSERSLQQLLDTDKSDPLSKAFKLPRWVKAWSPGGWDSFGQTMRERWVQLQGLAEQRTRRNWLIAYGTGFATALVLLLACVLIACGCVDRKRRNDAVRLFCGPLRNKTGKWSVRSHGRSSNRAYWSEIPTTTAVTPTFQPCHLFDQGHLEERIHCCSSKSINSEPYTLTREVVEPRKLNNFFDCEQRNSEFLPFIDSKEAKCSRSLNRETGVLQQQDPSYAHRGYPNGDFSELQRKLYCSHYFGVCRPSECVYHKQQLDQLLKLMLSMLRRSHGDDHYDDHQILRLCFQIREQLRESAEELQQEQKQSRQVVPICCPPEGTDKCRLQSVCFPATTCPVCAQRQRCETCAPPRLGRRGVPLRVCSPSPSNSSSAGLVEPSAPPPSYEQCENENSQLSGQFVVPGSPVR